MTTRKTLFIDRIATLVLALVLIAGGGAAIWWWSGQSLAGYQLADTSDTSAVSDVVDAAWFGWAAAAVGIVLALVGIRWIAAHLTTARVARLTLGGSDATGRLDVAGSKVAGAAAQALADTVGVRSAKGAVVRDRGQLVAHLAAVIEPEADLALVARRADEVSAQLAEVLERDDLRCSVQLRVAARGRTLPRASYTPARASPAPAGKNHAPPHSTKEKPMGLADKAKNAAEDLVGKAKEVVGEATNNDSLKAEGKKDQAKSDIKSAGENVKDAFKK